MSIAQIVERMYEKTGYQKSNLHFIMTNLAECLREALGKDGSVQINGIGNFSIVTKKARTGRNPRTGESIEIPEKKFVHFKIHKSLRDAFQK